MLRKKRAWSGIGIPFDKIGTCFMLQLWSQREREIQFGSGSQIGCEWT